jgi:DNA-binding NtrC family response regulator
VDLRVVCATNRQLSDQVREMAFRPDLYARIAEVEVRLPRLERRAEDIPLLVAHFIDKHAEDAGLEVSVDALELLCCSSWPFNIRQLESAVRRAILAAGSSPALLPTHFAVEGAPGDQRSTAEHSGDQEIGIAEGAVEARGAGELPARARKLLDALREHSGKVDRVAEDLGISRSQVYRRAKKHGIKIEDFKE